MAKRPDSVRETLRISARADYAIRATAAIAAVPHDELTTADELASSQGSGGYRLARDTDRVHALWASLRTSLDAALERTTIADVLAGRQPTLDR